MAVFLGPTGRPDGVEYVEDRLRIIHLCEGIILPILPLLTPTDA